MASRFSPIALAASVVALGSSSTAETQVKYLVVGASASSASDIARASQPLFRDFPDSFVFRAADCGERTTFLGVALGSFDSLANAKASLAVARARARGAYLRVCKVAPHSLLALGFPAVDRSIADVPRDAVNWSEADRLSGVIALPDGRHVVAQRAFVPDRDDPDEGRRVRIQLVNGDGRIHLLREDCPLPGAFVSHEGLVGFQCAGEEAGGHLLHDSFAFDEEGRQRAAVASCRTPRFSSGTAMVCRAEEVDSHGRLRLHRTRVSLTATETLPAH